MRNRPRVFLSHSKADVTFISQLYEDLRHCQIDPWLDSIDIRHGEPWLETHKGQVSTLYKREKNAGRFPYFARSSTETELGPAESTAPHLIILSLFLSLWRYIFY